MPPFTDPVTDAQKPTRQPFDADALDGLFARTPGEPAS